MSELRASHCDTSVTGRGGKQWPLLPAPWGGWTRLPSGDPNLTVTLTSIPPPTSKFNPNTSSALLLHPSTLWPGPSLRGTSASGSSTWSDEKKDDEIRLLDKIHSVCFFSSFLADPLPNVHLSSLRKKRRKKTHTAALYWHQTPSHYSPHLPKRTTASKPKICQAWN